LNEDEVLAFRLIQWRVLAESVPVTTLNAEEAEITEYQSGMKCCLSGFAVSALIVIW
jgi:hypothetical protein